MMGTVQWLAPVALGGAAGAVLRVLAMRPFAIAFGSAAWPWSLVFVNVSGSFLIGVLWAYLAASRLSQDGAALLITGLLGGYTTFSSFSLDTIRLMEAGRFGAALGYVLASVALSLGAAYLGLILGRALA